MDGVRQTPLLKGDMTQSPAVSQVTGTRTCPPLPVHHTSSPPLCQPSWVPVVSEEAAEDTQGRGLHLDQTLMNGCQWNHWALFTPRGSQPKYGHSCHGAESGGSLCEGQHQTPPGLGLRSRGTRHPSRTAMLVTCIRRPGTSPFLST